MIGSLASSAHQAHASIVTYLAAEDPDPLKPKETKLPTGMEGPMSAALGILVLLVVIVAAFMLLRAIFEAVAAYRDGAAVPFGSILMILLFLIMAVGGISLLLRTVVGNAWI
ncbi:hypothetical protein [Yinghuangia soli]|uniref:Uncharacterized protein n=1 Tax=Yinghuangia soli TaxID=2908204 RepID=A0AA41PWZ5_9ACTN|nr:hypothetical protein [Yinghuangia soli]MCF2526731.1 hypothetical protein [Yinghuangia soli]